MASVQQPQSCPGPGVPLCVSMPVGAAGEAVCDCAYVGELVLGTWVRATVPKCDDRSVSEQKYEPLSMCLDSGGSRTPIMLVTEGAAWVLAEKRPPRESLSL